MTTIRKSIRAPKRPRARAATPASHDGRWSAPRNGARSVRWSKIQTAQARIASGFYERDEVQAFVVDALLRELRRPSA